jgi:N-dimethylarginine dimethylaminohydrolase
MGGKITLGDHKEMRAELNSLEETYARLGVEVIRIYSKSTDAVFHRDVAGWTPHGMIQARMGKASRAWEPQVWFDAVQPKRAPINFEHDEHFEGADLVWHRSYGEDLAIIACGQRTNVKGASRIISWLEYIGVRCHMVNLPPWHDQHLLGVFNHLVPCLDKLDYHDVRSSHPMFAVSEFKTSLRAWSLPQEEYEHKCTNWVQVGENVIICDRAQRTIQHLEHFRNVIPVKIDSLLAHGGGVACATGIVEP